VVVVVVVVVPAPGGFVVRGGADWFGLELLVMAHTAPPTARAMTRPMVAHPAGLAHHPRLLPPSAIPQAMAASHGQGVAGAASP
jgi:hypothetical protein